MTAAAAYQDSLPVVRGRLTANAPLRRLSWFRTGGSADILFEPADVDDLISFLRELPGTVPVTVLGVGSNLLVRDGGVEGVVIRLGRGFADINTDADSLTVTAGAGAMDVHVARAAADAGIAGVEFLVGVPGTIGGAVRMNAGAYGRELKDVFVSATAVDLQGQVHKFSAEDMGFSYRKCALPTDLIFVKTVMKGSADKPEVIHARMNEISQKRAEAQPIGTRTGGSTFKNPVGEKSAWQLVDEAGCRGMQIGDAMVSEKHTNFLINLGSASASEIEKLGETVRTRVKATSGVSLEWEIKRIGRLLTAGDANNDEIGAGDDSNR